MVIIPCGAILGLALLTFGCSKITYRLDVQQGNVITQEMVDKLEPGMDKPKVEFILGTPLVTDVFNRDRWDYVYTFKPGGGEMTERRLILFFENERLVRIEGDIQPRVGPREELPRSDTVVSVPDSNRKRGFLGRIGGWFSKEKDTTSSDTPSEVATQSDEKAEEPPISE